MFSLFVLGCLVTAASATYKNWCPNKSFYEFIPVHVGSLQLDADSQTPIEWESPCFEHNSASITKSFGGLGLHSFTISITASGPKDGSRLGGSCTDIYHVWPNQSDLPSRIVMKDHVGETPLIYMEKDMSFEILENTLSPFNFYMWPCGGAGTVESIAKTASMFLGKNQAAANVDFFKTKLDFDMQPRTALQDLEAKDIRSGDILHVLKLDGIDPLIAFGTGGRTGHVTTALWNAEHTQLYILEATDVSPGAHKDWPPPYGIIKTPFERWVKQARGLNYNTVVAPLKKELSDAFDVDAAWAFFNQNQGLPYGYNVMLYTFLDTSPSHNLPQPIDDAVFNFIFNKWDEIMNDLAKLGVNVEKLIGPISPRVMIIAGLNQRLKTECETFECIDEVLRARKQHAADIAAMPELDTYIYDYEGKKGRQMVCSVLAFGLIKAGMGGDSWFKIKEAEQTPVNVYQAEIYDSNYFDESNCPNGLIKNPTGGTTCQITGTYTLALNEYNSMPLYDNMNERCGSQWPNFQRCVAPMVAPCKC